MPETSKTRERWTLLGPTASVKHVLEPSWGKQGDVRPNGTPGDRDSSDQNTYTQESSVTLTAAPDLKRSRPQTPQTDLHLKAVAFQWDRKAQKTDQQLLLEAKSRSGEWPGTDPPHRHPLQREGLKEPGFDPKSLPPNFLQPLPNPAATCAINSLLAIINQRFPELNPGILKSSRLLRFLHHARMTDLTSSICRFDCSHKYLWPGERSVKVCP